MHPSYTSFFGVPSWASLIIMWNMSTPYLMPLLLWKEIVIFMNFQELTPLIHVLFYRSNQTSSSNKIRLTHTTSFSLFLVIELIRSCERSKAGIKGQTLQELTFIKLRLIQIKVLTLDAVVSNNIDVLPYNEWEFYYLNGCFEGDIHSFIHL